jgi:hypothetical protein
MASVPLPVSWEILGWVVGFSGDLLPGPLLVGRRSVRPPTPPSQKVLSVVAVIFRWIVGFTDSGGDF